MIQCFLKAFPSGVFQVLLLRGKRPTRRTRAIGETLGSAAQRPGMEDDDVRALNRGSAYVTTFAYPSVLCCLAG